VKLWQKLRNRQLGVEFRRQHPAGDFILDFYCPALRLAIELDDGHHVERAQRDRDRDAWLARRDVSMLRFWNSDVTTNLLGVLETIASKISERKAVELTTTRRWRADLPLAGGGDWRKGRA
jgi:very-short-patch-repair endonuclease